MGAAFGMANTIAFMNPTAASLLLLLLVPAEEKPTPKLPLGKETTYLTEPLDKDGYVDYEAALNERMSKGIAPEKNANTLLWKLLGPKPDGLNKPANYFQRLGIEPPSEDGEYFMDLNSYLRERLHITVTDSQWKPIAIDQYRQAERSPWTANDYPEIATWLKVNEKLLGVAVEASQRPDYFNPIVSRATAKHRDLLSGATAVVGPLGKCREAASALAIRATLRISDGKFDDAWQDLVACQRIARHAGHGGTLVEGLFGFGINSMAHRATLVYLDRAELNAKQIKDRLDDLAKLPGLSPLAEKVEFGERFVFLDTLQRMHRGDTESATLEVLLGIEVTPELVKALEKIDWEQALRSVNQWYDRVSAALRLKDRADREKEFDKIGADLKALTESLSKQDLAKLVLDNEKPKEAGKAVADALIAKFPPTASRNVQKSFDRCQQMDRNLQVAFALAAYRSDKGSYPAKLDDLAPKYLTSIPDDLFSGKSLIYRQTEKGYLLYSVGPNGKDDEGRSGEDDPAGDDIVVRMPRSGVKGSK